VPYAYGYGWFGTEYYNYVGSGTYTAANYGGTGVVSYTSYAQYAQNIQVQSNNTSGGAHNHPITFDMQYCDVIICSKN
jgi:hypothetical protein